MAPENRSSRQGASRPAAALRLTGGAVAGGLAACTVVAVGTGMVGGVAAAGADTNTQTSATSQTSTTPSSGTVHSAGTTTFACTPALDAVDPEFGFGKCMAPLTVTPPQISADGKQTSTVEVTLYGCYVDVTDTTVTDRSCDLLNNYFDTSDPIGTFTFTSSDEKENPITATWDPSKSTFSAKVGPSSAVETVTITATDVITAQDIPQAVQTGAGVSQSQVPASVTLTGTAKLAQVATMTLAVAPGSIPADGKSTSTVTATVTGANGQGIAGQTVTFSSSDPGQTFGAVTDEGNGVYKAAVTASKTAGAATITATDSSVTPKLTATGSLTQTAVAVAVPVATTTPPVTAPKPTLAFTGSETGTLAGIGAMFCGAGAALVIGVRKRRPRFLHSSRR